MIKVQFYNTVEDHLLQFAVIISRYQGQWVFCKHRKRDTWEVPGGRREEDEAIEETAKRELYEETGAIDFSLSPVCVYSVTRPHEAESFGMLYFSEIRTLEPELHNEIEQICLMDAFPDSWTYPEIQPKLLKEAERRGFFEI